MKRIVITGVGIVSSLGNNTEEVTQSLKEGKSGIVFAPEYAENGMRSQVHGAVKNLEFKDHIDRKQLRFMGDAAAYSYIAMEQAGEDSCLTEKQISNPRTGLIAGSGGGSNSNSTLAVEIAREKGVKRVGPYMVTRTMGSTVSACLATPFKIKGINYSISSACSTSAHCIGTAVEQIQLGKQDVVFAGGGEELHWTMSGLFDGMGALSSKYNDAPETAARAYDATRDGFVISGGGGALVLESLEHAQTRGATILAELTGYGATSDGYDMVVPSGEGAKRCMQLATSTVKGPIDYINAHGTSTPAGDVAETQGIKSVFGEHAKKLMVSSSKSMTGHLLGAAGGVEAIFSLLAINRGVVPPTIHYTEPDPEFDLDYVPDEARQAEVNIVLSSSLGFGGTNATLLFRKV